MKTAALALLLFVSGGAAAPVQPVTHAATMLLEFENETDWGTCSATAIGPNKLLSATHCFEDGIPLVRAGGEPVAVTGRVDDGNDHTILTVTVTFKRWARMGGLPTRGERVRIWGNPAGMRDLYREGYLSGWHDGWLMYEMPVDRGDSGAAIFNGRGLIVGMVSIVARPGQFLTLCGGKPFKFTKEQMG